MKSVRYGRLRWYLLAAVALVTVAVVGVRLVDLDTLRPRAQNLASNLLGLEVTIDGAIGLRLTPLPQVVVGQVRLGDDGAPVAKADEVRLRFALALVGQGADQPGAFAAQPHHRPPRWPVPGAAGLAGEGRREQLPRRRGGG